MRLLVLCERVGHLGGMETYLRYTLPALAARGHELHIITRDPTDKEDATEFTSLENIPWSDEHDHPSNEAATRIRATAQRFQPDVAIAHNTLDSAVLEAARDCAPQFTYHIHDHRPFCPNGDRVFPRNGGICTAPMGSACAWHSLTHGCAYGPRPRTIALIQRREILRNAIARADNIVAYSQYMGRSAQENGISADRIRVFHPPQRENTFGGSITARPTENVVLFAGRVVPQKGGSSLIDALAKIPVAERPILHVAGEGPALSAMLARAKRNGVRTEALGHLGDTQMRAAYDAATIVAIPSLWAEPFGSIGIEAFTRGRPVVAYAVGGIPEWIGNGGIDVPVHDTTALSRAMLSLLETERWERASAAAHTLSKHYALASHIDALVRVYQSS